MTNEQLFEDLKQFIAVTVTQQTSEIRQDITEVKGDVAEIKGDLAEVKQDVQGMRNDLVRLERKVDDGFAGVGATIEIINQRIDDLETDMNARFTKLEPRAA